MMTMQVPIDQEAAPAPKKQKLSPPESPVREKKGTMSDTGHVNEPKSDKVSNKPKSPSGNLIRKCDPPADQTSEDPTTEVAALEDAVAAEAESTVLEEEPEGVFYRAECWRSYSSFLEEQGVREVEPKVEETPDTHLFSAPLSDEMLAKIERGRRNFFARINARHAAGLQVMPGLASGSSASR